MPDELRLRLVASPTLKIANIGLGDLSGRTESQRADLRNLSSVAKRRDMTRAGFTMRSGAFPIENVSGLRDALLAYTFAEDRPAAKRWIIRRARALSRTDVLPESWGVAPLSSVTAAAQTHTGVMVAVYPPSNVAEALAGTQDGDEPVEELHVTLAYLGDSSEFTEVEMASMRNALANITETWERGPLTAQVQGVGSFVSPEGDDPRWYSVDAVGLADLRTRVVGALELNGIEPRVDHDFTPHMTIRYGGKMATEVPPGGDVEWSFDRIWLVVAGDRHEFVLGEPRGGTDEPTDDELIEKIVSEAEAAAAQAHDPIVVFENGNNLERYWKAGEGATKIRWGTSGDFTRCHRSLIEHVGDVRARRICAQWHYDMNGMWPGDKRNNSVLSYEEGHPMTKSVIASANAEFSTDFEFFWNPDTDETFRVKGDVVEIFAHAPEDDESVPTWREDDVSADDVRKFPTVDDEETLQTIVGAAASEDTTPAQELPDGAGRRFRIPIVIPEGVPSGDRRSFTANALEFKEPPIPLLWQKVTDEGHKGSVTVGKITHIERIEGGIGNAEGVFDTHADAIEAARQVRDRFLTGVSGDVDQFEAELSEGDNGEESIEIRHGRLVAATLVAKPAFQEATIEFVTESDEPEVITASAGPLHPPRAWFTDPKLDKPTPLDVTDEGRVFGHIAEWNTPHTGNPALVPPRSKSGYKYFNRLPLRTAEGTDVFVGNLTLVGGHADLDLPPERVVAHYDNTKSAVADVVAGEDEFGIWVSGAMRPDVSDEQVRAFRASDPSGDWRMKPEGLELLAVCQVNTPGFPVARSLVADGQPMALVAAGMSGLTRREDRSLTALVASLEKRLSALENERRDEKAAALYETIESLRN